MGKKKKKIIKKINPEKSNKMIIAVAVGVVIVLALFILLSGIGSGGSKEDIDKGELMNRLLKYLKAAEGIGDLKFYPEQNKVVIIYESYPRSKQDFPKIAQYAGLRLSYQMGDEELTIVLARDKEEQAVRSYTIKGGSILEEKILSQSDSASSDQ